MDSAFTADTLKTTRKEFNTKTFVLFLLMFYDNIIIIMFKVLEIDIYSLFDSDMCLYYICLHQEKLSKKDKLFNITTFDNISGVGITDVLINIISCHGFSI